MKTLEKYFFVIKNRSISLPVGAEIVGISREAPSYYIYLEVLADKSNPIELRWFKIVEAGDGTEICITDKPIGSYPKSYTDNIYVFEFKGGSLNHG